MALYGNSFAKVFSGLLDKSGVTCYQLKQYVHLDEAYLSRLKNGQKGNPSPETVVRICLVWLTYNSFPGIGFEDWKWISQRQRRKSR